MRVTPASSVWVSVSAKITVVPVTQVHDTIEQKIASLKSEGKKPYFIEGGGHGNNAKQEVSPECEEELWSKFRAARNQSE